MDELEAEGSNLAGFRKERTYENYKIRFGGVDLLQFSRSDTYRNYRIT
jgi:hypothetical protein